MSCGACCAAFRVQFYWREANAGETPHPAAVPAHLCEELTPRHRGMKGTGDKHHPKCAGLRGRIGVDASCSIYLGRPTPCREFAASYADGRRQPRCDEARAKHGLRPLQRQDWE